MRTVYRSATDGMTWWGLTLILVCCILPVAIAGPEWWGVVITVVSLAICLIPFVGMRYVIDGRELVVYVLFMSERFPIDKMAEIRPVKSVLSAPALAYNRLGITFTDRKILKSYAPMMISPVRRNEFIAQLLAINPDIKVLDK